MITKIVKALIPPTDELNPTELSGLITESMEHHDQPGNRLVARISASPTDAEGQRLLRSWKSKIA